MARHNRTKPQREMDRARMMEMLRRGYTQTKIAKELGLTTGLVSYEYRAMLKRLGEENSQHYRALVALKMEEYSEVKTEAWSAWERSKADSQKVQVDEYSGGEGEEKGGKTSTTTEKQVGDSGFLRIIAQCLEAEIELMGLKPLEKKVDDTEKIDWAVVAQEIEQGCLDANSAEAKLQRLLESEKQVIEVEGGVIESDDKEVAEKDQDLSSENS